MFKVTDVGAINTDPYDDSNYSFAVDDLVTVKTDTLMGLAQTYEPNSYGLPGYYHLYDTLGASTAATTNPGTTTASSAAQENPATRTYYSLFVEYCTAYNSGTGVITKQWKKSGETSALIVKDNGTVDVMVNHLPSFYVSESQTSSGNDLIDFLRVFSFQLDIYKAEAKNVFNSVDTLTADEQLLKLLLKELGVPFYNVGDVSQARTLAANIIKIYKESGSLVGLETLIEAYTGYGVNISAGRNLLLDYNSASFEENTGFWTHFHELEGTPTIGVTLTTTGPVDNGVTAFSDAQTNYGRTGDDVTGATCTTGSTTVTGTFTANVKPGSFLYVTSTAGTGVLATGTVVTSILSSTSFRINYPPTTSLSSATLRASTNMVTGMGKMTTSTTTSGIGTITLGKKQAQVTASATATTTVIVSPPIAEVNDYVFVDSSDALANLGTYTKIPYGVTVSSIGTTTATTQSITLSSAVTIPASLHVGFSRFAAEPVGASGALLPVVEGMPYAFSAYVNSGSSITGTNSATISANLAFMNQLSQITSLTPGNSVTISTSAANTNKWVPVVAQGIAEKVDVYPVSPDIMAKVTYLAPSISINGVTSSRPFYIDAVQLDGPIHVVAKEIPTSTTATITTETAHNYSASAYGISGSNYVTVAGLGEPFDGTFPIVSTTVTAVTYSISSTSTAAQSVADGYCASNTPYQDPRKVTVDVLPNRINLITNPSFEVDTNFWGTSTVASTTAGVNCTITSTTADYYVSSRCMSMTSTGTSHMSVYGFAGEVNSGVVSSYVKPFIVERSTSIQEIQYTLSFYTKAASTARDCYAEIYWYKDADGTIPSDITPVSTGTTASNSTSEWTRYSITATSPSDAVSSKVEVHVNSTANGEVHYVDAVLFEKGYSVAPYFDGDFDGQNYTSDRDSVWETGGTANKCRSHFYLNRVENTGRLKTILTDGVYYA